MATVPGPPPSTRDGHSGVASVRLRRTCSVKSNQEIGRSKTQRDPLMFQHPRREQLESDITIASLQENLSALTALNRRETALSTALKDEVEQLKETLNKLNGRLEDIYLECGLTNGRYLLLETHEKEKVDQEKTVKRREDDGFLPHISGKSTVSASTAALQQNTQMEVSYQRKILSLENRCLHMAENNKKLLAMIQQFENAQNEVNVQLRDFRLENARLQADIESLNSTITSQSALIVGLRSTVQRLSRDEKLAEQLKHSLERCQRELEAVKKREKLLHEEYTKFKAAASQEKEVLMSKILGFQQHLQRIDTADGNVTALETKIKRLEKEKEATKVELEAMKSRCEHLQTRVVQLDQLPEDFIQVKTAIEKEKADMETILNSTRQELDFSVQKQQETEARAQAAEARNASIQELRDLLQTRDDEVGTLMQKSMRLEDDIKERDQRHTHLQDEFHKVNTELQGLKQLSHDETVQALQMARQKAATYEALTLLNEEKKALEEQLRLVQERLETEIIALQVAKEAKEQTLAALDTHTLTIEELRKENAALREQIEQGMNSQAPGKETTAVEIQTVEEIVSPDTHAQTTSELAQATTELENLRSEFEDLQQEHEEMEDTIQSLRQNQDQMENGYRKTVSRERYKSESFQSQLKLLQNENGELSDKMEALCKDLMKEQQLNDAQTLEMTELKQRVLSRETIYLLRKTQDSLEQTVNSLLEAENASESTFTCLQCMQLFTHPMTLAPCGHTYCATCLPKCGDVEMPSSIACKMCETEIKKETESIFPNYALADLTARFIFRQQSLASLTTMCLSLRNSFTQREE
ncbi:hypothetical protein P3T76_011237 [Phytophthora citrophthora]|uniref:RING-type domain-containing protein n=1 Tax=Phytophthora citrophthora TaxID=4793 RepID=A0AAD9LFE4_9STRA|nr:hypothetical protein P3T76_011237 [Phytophthora citrophthora]